MTGVLYLGVRDAVAAEVAHHEGVTRAHVEMGGLTLVMLVEQATRLRDALTAALEGR